MFTGLPSGPPQTGGSLAPEPVSGDSLTQFIRAFSNYLQNQGQGTFNYGQDLTGQGAQGFQTAGQTLQPSVDYWTKLLSGDPSAVSSAIAPTANVINKQYDTASRQAATTLPRGGYSSGLQASLPFQKAAQIGNLAEGLQPLAAQGLQSSAGLQGSLAQGLGGLGLGTGQLGSGLLNLAGNTQLTRRGQNYGVDINNISNLTKGLTSLVPGSSFNFGGH